MVAEKSVGNRTKSEKKWNQEFQNRYHALADLEQNASPQARAALKLQTLKKIFEELHRTPEEANVSMDLVLAAIYEASRTSDNKDGTPYLNWDSAFLTWIQTKPPLFSQLLEAYTTGHWTTNEAIEQSTLDPAESAIKTAAISGFKLIKELLDGKSQARYANRFCFNFFETNFNRVTHSDNETANRKRLLEKFKPEEFLDFILKNDGAATAILRGLPRNRNGKLSQFKKVTSEQIIHLLDISLDRYKNRGCSLPEVIKFILRDRPSEFIRILSDQENGIKEKFNNNLFSRRIQKNQYALLTSSFLMFPDAMLKLFDSKADRIASFILYTKNPARYLQKILENTAIAQADNFISYVKENITELVTQLKHQLLATHPRKKADEILNSILAVELNRKETLKTYFHSAKQKIKSGVGDNAVKNIPSDEIAKAIRIRNAKNEIEINRKNFAKYFINTYCKADASISIQPTIELATMIAQDASLMSQFTKISFGEKAKAWFLRKENPARTYIRAIVKIRQLASAAKPLVDENDDSNEIEEALKHHRKVKGKQNHPDNSPQVVSASETANTIAVVGANNEIKAKDKTKADDKTKEDQILSEDETDRSPSKKSEIDAESSLTESTSTQDPIGEGGRLDYLDASWKLKASVVEKSPEPVSHLPEDSSQIMKDNNSSSTAVTPLSSPIKEPKPLNSTSKSPIKEPEQLNSPSKSLVEEPEQPNSPPTPATPDVTNYKIYKKEEDLPLSPQPEQSKPRPSSTTFDQLVEILNKRPSSGLYANSNNVFIDGLNLATDGGHSVPTDDQNPVSGISSSKRRHSFSSPITPPWPKVIPGDTPSSVATPETPQVLPTSQVLLSPETPPTPDVGKPNFVSPETPPTPDVTSKPAANTGTGNLSRILFA
jgi:hypothetical protein